MFVGGKPEDAFYVQCNNETNTRDTVARGMLICEIGIAPAVPAEFLMIRIAEHIGSSKE